MAFPDYMTMVLTLALTSSSSCTFRHHLNSCTYATLLSVIPYSHYFIKFSLMAKRCAVVYIAVCFNVEGALSFEK